MDFTAIDFETANPNPQSACAVGLACVRDGCIVETFDSLIRPTASEFWSGFIAIHGIRPAMVIDAPSFAELWPELETRIGDTPLVAHNAPFDRRVMEACLGEMGQPPLATEWICTVRLARRQLPDLPNHKLNTVAAYYNLDLDHHNAASDAIVAAQLAIRLWE